MTSLFKKIRKDCRGQELVEYALIAGFLVTAAAASIPSVANDMTTVFSKVVVMLSESGGSDGSGAPRS